MRSRSRNFEVLERASARWDELVESEEASTDGLATVRDRVIERGVAAGGRPLCAVLRPHLITEALLAHQSTAAAHVLSAAAKVRDAVLADEELHRLHLGSSTLHAVGTPAPLIEGYIGCVVIRPDRSRVLARVVADPLAQEREEDSRVG